MDVLTINDVSEEVSDTLEKIGINVTSLDSDEAMALKLNTESGVLISEVSEGSSAWRAGIQPGQIITNVNRKPVSNIEDFSKVIQESSENDSVLFLITDGKGSRFVVINIDK